jgi:acetate kinase
MSDALLVLNAGSSSLKFSVFLDQDLSQPVVRGQIEGLTGQPRFVARNDSISGWVIPANEELMIALHTQRVLRAAPGI